MKLERRYLAVTMAVILLILLMLVLMLSRSLNSGFSLFGDPNPTPIPAPQPIPVSAAALPQGAIDPGDENTFSAVTGYIINTDPEVSYKSWKDAATIQAQGELVEWTDNALLLGVQDGQLTIYTPPNLRYYCRPVTVPGIDGKPPMKTQDLYAPINEPEKVGVVIDREEIKRLLPADQTIYVVANRNNDVLEAVLIAGYGCGYPIVSQEVNP
jgi:hypothetical protein